MAELDENKKRSDCSERFWLNRLLDEVAEIDFASCLYPLCEGADAAARNHEHDWLASCWVDNRFLLQIWHLATLRFDVGVADIVARKRRFASDHADFGHKRVGVSNAGMLPDHSKLGKH